jgi:hypothetical protein
MINEEEANIDLAQYKVIIEGLKQIFTEFNDKCNKGQEEEIVTQQQTFKKRETKVFQSLVGHEYYKLLQMSHHYTGKLTLLDEKQASDENDSYQKIMNLFLEENDTISNISNNKNDVNKYLITQLYTAFSLLCRKVYLSGDKIDSNSEAEKARDFLKHLNSIKFDKDSKLTNQILAYFNHNILRIEDIYQKKDNKNTNAEAANAKKKNIDQYDKKGFIIEAHEIKKKVGTDRNNITALNALNQYNELDNENVILNDENKEEAVQQVDSISYVKQFGNIDLSNEDYKKIKSINMRKILEIDEEKLKKITNEEFKELISEVYENGELKNKDIEDKITDGKGNLFNEQKSEHMQNSQISLSNKIENDLFLNSDEKIINDEEVISEKYLDFEQEEIKDDENKNSFFERGESFSKDFFAGNSDDDDDKKTSKQFESISHKSRIDLSNFNQSKGF